MSIDNPGDFYLAENFGEENNDDRPVTILGNMLFRKAIDILNITRTISDLLPEEEDGPTTRDLMMQNVTAIPGKIKAAQAVDIYSLKMENAVIIKVNIMELRDQIWACETMHDIDKQYTKVLTDELITFKAIFINWIKNFDKSIDLPDTWRIFNDPASFPPPKDDKSPGEEGYNGSDDADDDD